jgi:hypothetical protein
LNPALKYRCNACAFLGAAALLASPAVSAQTAKPGADDWKFGASVYVWLPSVEVKSNFPIPPALIAAGGAIAGRTQVDGDDFIDSIESMFMGSFEARKGRWGGFIDFITLDLGKTKTGSTSFTVGGNVVSVPVNAALTGDYSLEGSHTTLAGQYAAIDEPGHNLNVLAGARYFALDQKFTWAFSGNIGAVAVPLRSGTLTSDGSITDFIIGLRGRARLGDGRWFIPYYGDIGFGQSDSSYQAMLGLGYAFDWGEITAAYRVLNYELPDSKFASDVRFHGGQVGLGFRW